MNDLARRAVAAMPRWMPGMLYHMPNWGPVRLRDEPQYAEAMKDCAEAVLDLTDPATLGCLLHLVWEAWGCPVMYAIGDMEVLEIGRNRWESWESGEVLVDALEAAPMTHNYGGQILIERENHLKRIKELEERVRSDYQTICDLQEQLREAHLAATEMMRTTPNAELKAEVAELQRVNNRLALDVSELEAENAALKALNNHQRWCEAIAIESLNENDMLREKYVERHKRMKEMRASQTQQRADELHMDNAMHSQARAVALDQAKRAVALCRRLKASRRRCQTENVALRAEVKRLGELAASDRGLSSLGSHYQIATSATAGCPVCVYECRCEERR